MLLICTGCDIIYKWTKLQQVVKHFEEKIVDSQESIMFLNIETYQTSYRNFYGFTI